MRINKLVLALALAFGTQTTLAADPQVNPVRASGGMSQEFRNHRFEPSASPLALPVADRLTPQQQRVAQQAADVFRNTSALTMLIVDRGQIIYEGYREPANRDTAQFSWSMSKSLTAYTIGNLLCDGKIASLDDSAKKYMPALEGSVQGEVSIRHLLMMSSGNRDAVASGNNYKIGDRDDWTDMRGGHTGAMELIQRFGRRDIDPGTEFRYNSNDTRGLNAVAQSRGGLIQNFNQYIWSQARTENPGYWLLDRDGWPIAEAGISATTRDWARLAMYSIKMQKSGSSCIQGFMQAATTQQIANRTKRNGRAFDGYGYQTWTNPQFGNRRSYWWVGYGGQRVGIDAERERIIVVTSWREDYMADVYRLFTELQRY